MRRRHFLADLLRVGGALVSAAWACAPRSGARRAGPGAGPAAGAPGAPADDPPARGPDTLPPSPLPLRTLGATGASIPILVLGGHHAGLAARRDGAAAGRAVVEAALEQGVRLFDTAESYQDGGSESLYGEVLAGVRDEVLLMTKTHAPATRGFESAQRHLDGSLARLRTDRLDLWQLHSVEDEDDVDRAFRDDGAMARIVQAKEEGVVRWSGVTGHVNPRANLRALHHFDRGWRFDVMQMPVNPLDHHQVSFQRDVLPALVERGIGVLAMKTSGGGALVERGLTTIEENLRYVAALPVSALVVGMETPAQVAADARVLREDAPLDEDERAALLARLEEHVTLDHEWYKRA